MMTVDVILLLLPLAGAHATFWGILIGNLVYLRRQHSSSLDSYPFLSICIPARNEAENLRRLLPSLQSQNYPNFEIVVWDDGSEDDTWKVLQSTDDPRIIPLRGESPPEGWVGKVHALYQATRRASGEYYLFLDADAELLRPDALQRWMDRHVHAPTRVSSGFPHLRGGALLVVSLLPHALLRSLPWFLVARTASPSLSALNGQCWLIDRALYDHYEPHAEVQNEILEDVSIGRYLKSQGHPPSLLAIQDLVAVHMYQSLKEAWLGFRKNAYLLLGGTVWRFSLMYAAFVLTWLVAPLLSGWFLVSLFGLKLVTDRASGMPAYVTLLAPVSYLLGLAIQLDSALHYWLGRISWKGRTVPSPSLSSTASENTES